MKLPFKISKGIVVVLHITFWLLLFSLPFLMQTYAEKRSPVGSRHPAGMSFYILKCLYWTAFFYVNAYYLFPRFFYKKRYGTYLLSLLVLLVCCIVLELAYFALTSDLSSFHLRGFILFNTFPFIFILTMSTTYRMVLDGAETARHASEKETEHLKTELSFLRSQISPHFMFNVLNGMVALARKKSDLLEPSLIKLSSIMRYMLYENDEEKVSLEKELEYLQSYVDLQKQRFGKSITVNTKIENIDKPYYIEPMLLIPFVENAFKHGTGLVEEATICICLKAVDDTLFFTVKNKYSGASEEIKDKTSGIGLNNVYRRLNLLYKHQHTLDIKKNDNFFTVTLELKLN